MSSSPSKGLYLQRRKLNEIDAVVIFNVLYLGLRMCLLNTQKKQNFSIKKEYIYITIFPRVKTYKFSYILEILEETRNEHIQFPRKFLNNYNISLNGNEHVDKG